MTQQQIAYINARTSRENLDVARTQAEAAMLQARTAQRQQDWNETAKYWTDVGTGVLSTVGSIIALALL